MKLTRPKLKQLIKEEIRESLYPSDRETQQALYDILVDNGLNEPVAKTLLSNIGMNTLKNLLGLLKPREDADENY